MTSTNISIGIEGRSSSRILKPPGGGHSDIFGIGQERIVVTSSRFSKQVQKSSISECFGYDIAPPPNKQELVLVQEQSEAVKTEVAENGQKNVMPTQDENTKSAVNVPAASQRVRVPPGGFSSGLW